MRVFCTTRRVNQTENKYSYGKNACEKGVCVTGRGCAALHPAPPRYFVCGSRMFNANKRTRVSYTVNHRRTDDFWGASACVFLKLRVAL